MNLPSFAYNELEEATSGFKEELGRGAFATGERKRTRIPNRGEINWPDKSHEFSPIARILQ